MFTSFVFDQRTRIFDRRERYVCCSMNAGLQRDGYQLLIITSKILTTIVSTFTAYYTHLWPRYFMDVPLTTPLPSFDGRVVLYPSIQSIRDYLSWRQVDCIRRRGSRFWVTTTDVSHRPHQQFVQYYLLGTSESGRHDHDGGREEAQGNSIGSFSCRRIHHDDIGVIIISQT